MKKLVVIILNYNSWEDTIKEVELVTEKAGINWSDIIVIDNCSTNNSAKELKCIANEKFIFLEAEANKGYASGNNIGLKYAYEKGYHYAWILNNDILMKDKLIVNKLLDIFDQSQDIAVVSPDIYSPDGYMYNRDAKYPNFYDLTFGMLAYRKKGRSIREINGFGYVYRPQGCCMIVDLQKLSEIGFMDENTFLYSEEIILAEKLLEKGYRCACCTRTQVIHNHSQTVKRNLNQNNIRKIQIESYSYYLKKYRKFNRLQEYLCRVFYLMKLMLLKN